MAVFVDSIVGVILAELLRAVSKAKNKSAKHKAILNTMETTLKSITPDLEKMAALKERLDSGNDEEITKLWNIVQNGKVLVEKCTKGGCPCFGKTDYTEALQELQTSLTSFCQIELPIRQRVAQLEMAEKVDDIGANVTDIGQQVKDTDNKVEGIHENVGEIQDEVGRITDNVKEVHDVLEDNRKDTKVIVAGVTAIDSGVKDTREEVKKTGAGVQKIQAVVEDSRDKLEDAHSDVKRLHEAMKDARSDVRNIQDEIQGVSEDVKHIRTKLDERNGSASTLSPFEPPDPPKLVVGLDMALSELKKEVLKKGMSVQVISAPGGCGKTTLAKILCHDKEVKGKFKDNILFVTVSRTPNLKFIIHQLLLHKGHKEPEPPNDEYATNRLEQLLKQLGKRPILLVLDDVWNGSESLIDSFIKPQLSDYKIVVTSRTRFPRFDSTIKLNKLTAEDSMRLFSNAACLEDENHGINEDTVNQVVRACKGFPLALTVVGKSLCRQSPTFWRKRLVNWSKGSSIFEDHPELVNCMKTSLDVLDNKPKLKECYFDLGSFPEGESIPAITLIDMWTELHEMNEDGTEFIDTIHELSASNLLDFVSRRKCTSECSYDDIFVTQHDLLRELVNYFNREDLVDQRKRLIIEIQRDEFPQWWREQKESPDVSRLISVTTDESFSLVWISMKAPKVKVLVLNILGKEYVLPEFATTMRKLKVLVVKSFGVFSAKIHNWPLLNKLSTLKKITLEQVLVPSLTLGITVRFENLQKLFLYKCDFNQTSTVKDIRRTSDLFPLLMEINISHSSNLLELPSGLCDLHQLKKLSITHCHQLSLLPKELTNLTNLEVLRLCSCKCLQKLPDTIESLDRLHILDISDCTSIEKLPEQIGELRSLEKLYMTGCSRCKLPKSVGNLKNLRVVICDEETAKLWQSMVESLPNMSLKKVQ